MLGAVRLFLGLLVVQTIAYVGLSIYSRRVRRSKLEAHWERKQMVGDKDAFIERGLRAYDKSFRRRLILGVYFVPWAAILTLIYVMNYM